MRTDFIVLIAALGIALGSMPVYALTGRYRTPDPLESSRRGKFILGGFVRSWFYWFVHPIVAVSLALRLTPTFYNLLGVALGIAGGVAFAMGHIALGGWGILLGGAADALDGRIARAQGVAGPRGAFMDATLDRFAEFGAFVGLAVWFADTPLALILVVAALGGSLITSYARARGEVEGVLCTAGIMQRAERLLILGFGGLLDPSLAPWFGDGTPGNFLIVALGVVAAGTVGTAVYRTIWITRRLPTKASDGE
ncbi:MAG: CDP-alcohol phosphatidyltransferase family protein [Gemmatimonadales bacterium]|nr:MAG: CDP-alcohol phosphatidyltransferase family protein [Gemmatimonadales bacterium]